MPANVTELPRSGRHVQIAPSEDQAVGAEQFSRWLFGAGAGATVAWLGLSVWYVQAYLGWAFLGALLPHEVPALVAGVMVPLAFLWLILVFVRPRRELRHHTETLRRQLALLTYPAEAAESRIRIVADLLHEQTDMLNRASDRAAVQLHEVADAMAQNTGLLTVATDNATQEVTELRSVLSEQATALSSLVDRFEAQQRAVREVTDKQTAELSRTARPGAGQGHWRQLARTVRAS